MVFATEYDPREQPSSRQSASPNNFPSDAFAPEPSARLITGSEQSFQMPDSVTANSAATNSTANSAVADNVVPLHLSGPARRVKVDPMTRTLVLPDRPNLPLGLRFLNRIQQGSTVLTCLLVTGALAVYGSTVYVDKSTNRALAQLDTLQGESQQLTSANEAIKQSLAEQAVRPDSGLELYEPGDVLFLAPLPRRAADVLPAESDTEMPRPLGY